MSVKRTLRNSVAGRKTSANGMPGNRILVWLAFGAFLCAIVIAALLVEPRRSSAGAELGAPSPFSAVPAPSVPRS